MGKQRTQTYQNIMEILVLEEVEKQLQKQPLNLREYIDPLEVATFALNRLPPMYASSLKGKRQQEIRAKQKYRQDIQTAVRQGLLAVTRDPLRSADPLPANINASVEAETVLQELEIFLRERDLLLYQNLTWINLIDSIQYVIDQLSKEKTITSQQKQETINRFKAWQKRQQETRISNLGEWADDRYHL